MDKKTFLEELRSSLSVLQETELNDIMDEYEQHIDMKVQSGLTEEEAIAEFGNRKELTAEILEAYHVRADYEAGQNGPEKREAKEKISLWSRVVQLWDSERRAVKRQILRCRDWFHKLFGKQKAAVSREKEKRAQRNGREDGTAQSGCMNSVSQKINRMSRRTGNLFSRLFAQSVRMISWCCRHIWTTALWCVKAGWNVLWIFFALLCGGFGLQPVRSGVLAVFMPGISAGRAASARWSQFKPVFSGRPGPDVSVETGEKRREWREAFRYTGRGGRKLCVEYRRFCWERF
ncbi:MAG: DUF1700 domain-containing protein [Clostridium sp.]